MRRLMLPLLLGTCGRAAGQGCTVNGCSITCPGANFDLSGFKQRTPPAGYFENTDSQQHQYFAEVCGPTTTKHCDAQRMWAPQSVAAVQSWDPSDPSACAVLGDYLTQSCSELPLGSAQKGVQCSYTRGDRAIGEGGRSVQFIFVCAPAYNSDANFIMTPAQDASADNAYTLTFAGPAGCPGGAPGPGPGGNPPSAPPASGGLSWGSIFLICFWCSLFVYCAGSIGYNYRYRELRGTDAIPQYDYWKQLPGLVKDGSIFSWEHAKLAYAKLRGRYVEMREGRRGLRAADEAVTEDDD